MRCDAGPRSVIAEAIPEVPSCGSCEEAQVVIELGFVAQQAIKTSGDAPFVMCLIDEEDVGQFADPLGG